MGHEHDVAVIGIQFFGKMVCNVELTRLGGSKKNERIPRKLNMLSTLLKTTKSFYLLFLKINWLIQLNQQYSISLKNIQAETFDYKQIVFNWFLKEEENKTFVAPTRVLEPLFRISPRHFMRRSWNSYHHNSMLKVIFNKCHSFLLAEECDRCG